MQDIKIVDTNAENILDFGVCGYKSIKRPGFPEKVDWFKRRLIEDMKIKTLLTETDGSQGMIEYIPGEFCWRPVDAAGYLFIHCIFVGFKKIYKDKGYASLLLEECLKDAKEQNKLGVAVVTRKGSFMADKDLFLKYDFKVVDTVPSDFELLALQFDKNAAQPKFKENLKNRASEYEKGLIIIRAFQCPYTVKNVNEICETAKTEYGINPVVIDMQTYQEAQDSPCAFGVFCIIYNGELIAEHPISKKRFTNIMNKLL